MKYPIYTSNILSIQKEVKPVPTLFFLNEKDEIIYSTTNPPEDTYTQEQLFKAFIKVEDA